MYGGEHVSCPVIGVNWHQLLCVSGVVHHAAVFVIDLLLLQLFCYIDSFLLFVKSFCKASFCAGRDGTEKGTKTRHEMKECKKTTLHLLCVFADVW